MKIEKVLLQNRVNKMVKAGLSDDKIKTALMKHVGAKESIEVVIRAMVDVDEEIVSIESITATDDRGNAHVLNKGVHFTAFDLARDFVPHTL